MQHLPGAPEEPSELPDRVMVLRPELRARIEALVGDNPNAIKALDAIDSFPFTEHQGAGFSARAAVSKLPIADIMTAFKARESSIVEAVGAGDVRAPNAIQQQERLWHERPNLCEAYEVLADMAHPIGKSKQPAQALAMIEAYPNVPDPLPGKVNAALENEADRALLHDTFSKLAEIDGVRTQFKEECVGLMQELGYSESNARASLTGIEIGIRS